MDMILADSVESLSRLMLFLEEHVFRHADLLKHGDTIIIMLNHHMMTSCKWLLNMVTNMADQLNVLMDQTTFPACVLLKFKNRQAGFLEICCGHSLSTFFGT